MGGYVKVREILYTRVIIWVNAILNHVVNKAILHMHESSCMIKDSNGIENKNTIKYPYSTNIK